MNAPVDVLAAMEAAQAYVDDAASFPEQFKPGVVKLHQKQLLDARSAMAELIKSCKAAEPLWTAWDGEHAAKIARAKAALANVGAKS